MLPWTMLKTMVQTNMIATSVGSPVATVIRNAAPVVMNPPIYGMKPRKNDRIAIGTATGSRGWS